MLNGNPPDDVIVTICALDDCKDPGASHKDNVVKVKEAFQNTFPPEHPLNCACYG